MPPSGSMTGTQRTFIGRRRVGIHKAQLEARSKYCVAVNPATVHLSCAPATEDGMIWATGAPRSASAVRRTGHEGGRTLDKAVNFCRSIARGLERAPRTGSIPT